MTIQIKATEQYFLVVLFVTLSKVVPTFESVNKILKSGYHLNESSCAVHYFPAQVLLMMLFKAFLAFASVHEILKFGHFNNCLICRHKLRACLGIQLL